MKEATRQRLHGEVRPAHPRGLRRHRDGAGARHQHADVQPLRHASAASCPAWRRGSSRCPASTRAAGSSCAAPTSCWAICAPRSPACSSRRRKAGTTPATSSRSTREGFVTIKGRAKRFAKIGGEMVSLAAVEALAAELWPDALSAVGGRARSAQGRAARPRHREGRRDARRLPGLSPRQRGAADLMMPAEVIVVDRVPVLGSGKLDYVGVAQMVRERPRPRPSRPRPCRARRRRRWRPLGSPPCTVSSRMPTAEAIPVLDVRGGGPVEHARQRRDSYARRCGTPASRSCRAPLRGLARPLDRISRAWLKRSPSPYVGRDRPHR